MELFIQQVINGLVAGMGYALVAVGLTLVFGILGVMNFAHGEFYMLGAYCLYVITSFAGLNYIFAGIISIIVISIIGAVVEKIIVRPTAKDQLSVVLATYALSLILMYSIQAIFTATPKSINSPFNNPITFGSFYVTIQDVIVILLGIICFISLNWIIKKTILGKQMRAISENKYASSVMGINISKVNTISFVIGAGLAALSGVLLSPIVSVYPTMGQFVLIKAFVIIVLGGMGNIYGAIVGGLILGVLEIIVGTYIGTIWQEMIGFLFLIITLLIWPSGILNIKAGKA